MLSSRVRKTLYVVAAVLGLLVASAVVFLFAPGQSRNVDDFEIKTTVRQPK